MAMSTSVIYIARRSNRSQLRGVGGARPVFLFMSRPGQESGLRTVRGASRARREPAATYGIGRLAPDRWPPAY